MLSAVDVIERSGPADVDIRDLAYDSRRAGPGTLFVAVPSVAGAPDSGGHRFLTQVAAQGAAAAVIQGGPPPDGIPWVRVADARAALADIAAAFFRHPSSDLDLFAVTGTDGKTTTSFLLEQVLAAAGRATGLIGTVETRILDRREYNHDRMTTPESLDLQRLLRRMADESVTTVAMEASSHALALDRLRACSFAAVAVTNITADHIEFHGSWEAYFAAKARLVGELAAGSPAVLNRDDPSFERLAEIASGPVIGYGLGPAADLAATVTEESARGTTVQVRFGSESVMMTVPLAGRYNVANALAATGLALCAGLDLPTIAAAMAEAEGPPGRMQWVDLGQPFDVVIDYAHTTNAFRSVLSGLHARRNGGKVIAVFGAAGNRDRSKRPHLAQIAREYADYFYVTNEDPFGEDPRAIIDEVAGGVDAGDEGTHFQREPDRGRAIALALERALPGDVVVITGKGHEQSIVVAGRKEPWSDLETVRRLLRERA